MMTMQRKTTPRLQGELFIVALEVTSLFLQRDDASLEKKWSALADTERRRVYRMLGLLYYYLGERL